MKGSLALQAGMRLSLRYWQVLVVLYLTSLLTAGCAAILPALSLLGPAHRPAITQAADGLDISFLMEAFLSPSKLTPVSGAVQNTPQQIQQVMSGIFLIVLILPLAAWLPASFIYGGVLSTFAGAPGPFQWRRFFRDCWHWFGLFLLLGLILGVANLIVAVNLVLYVIFPSIFNNPLVALVFSLVLILYLGASLALGELSRAAAVTRGTRRVKEALKGGIRLLVENPGELAGLYLLALILLIGLNLLFRLGLMRYLPLEAWVLVLLVQQGFIFVRLWVRAARLAGVVSVAGQPADAAVGEILS